MSEILLEANGMRYSGLHRLGTAGENAPLIIALHGGTYLSKYFDVPGYSLMERAAAMDIPIIAVDRPGYGESTALAPEESTILRNAEVLDGAIGKLWENHAAGRGVVLVGHSIGGAITVSIAARRPSWPLLGIAVSGVGLATPRESNSAWAALPKIPLIDLPTPMKDTVMFGPEWTYDKVMPQRSHVANTTVPRAELIDITSTWQEHVRETAAAVSVPVHYRQAEFDKLWIVNKDEVAGFGAAFKASPEVDAKLFANAGHCIDFHKLGKAFQLDQLAFALRCAIAKPA